jgi:hypothetical protein
MRKQSIPRTPLPAAFVALAVKTLGPDWETKFLEAYRAPDEATRTQILEGAVDTHQRNRRCGTRADRES